MQRQTNRSARIISIIIFSLFVAFSAPNVKAAILTVTKTADTDDGVCDADCSLREALDAAAERDFVQFSKDLGGATVQLQDTLRINKGVTLDGPNDHPVTISGNDSFRIFEVGSPGRSIGVGFDSVIITGGNAGEAGDGGGIYFNGGGVLLLLNTTVAGNKARTGGGIWARNLFSFQIKNSTVSGNVSTGPGGAGVDAYLTDVRLFSSTVSGNTALSKTAVTAGGMSALRGTVYLFNSTVADNRSLSGDAAAVGGVSTGGGPYPVGLVHTIVARNVGTSPDFRGPGGGFYNLIGAYGGMSFGSPDSHNLVGTLADPIDPLLSALGDHGGPTPTHALLAGSPAIDSGSIDYNGPVIDQRGYERVRGGAVDRGSLESGSSEIHPALDIVGRAAAPDHSGQSGYGPAVVTLTRNNGEKIYASANPFGYFRFNNIPLFETITIKIAHKRVKYSPVTYILQNPLIEIQPDPPPGAAAKQTELFPEFKLTDNYR